MQPRVQHPFRRLAEPVFYFTEYDFDFILIWFDLIDFICIFF